MTFGHFDRSVETTTGEQVFCWQRDGARALPPVSALIAAEDIALAPVEIPAVIILIGVLATFSIKCLPRQTPARSQLYRIPRKVKP